GDAEAAQDVLRLVLVDLHGVPRRRADISRPRSAASRSDLDLDRLPGMLRSPEEALELLRRERVITLTPVPGVRSLVGEIAGAVRGSWWGHPKGGLIFAIATALEDSSEVLGAKLVRGKVAFVHRALWPALLRVVLDPAWRKEAQRGLPTASRQLLEQVEEAGALRLEARGPAR